MTDSLPIMATLDAAFPQEPLMIPPEGSAARQEAESLLRLERELFSAWCRLTFSPGKGLFAAHNRLAQLPEDLGALTMLEEIDVSHNALSTLPGSLGQYHLSSPTLSPAAQSPNASRGTECAWGRTGSAVSAAYCVSSSRT